MDSENIIKYETAELSFEAISKARDDAIKNLSEPHFALGKIIAKYLPDFGSSFDKDAHITAVYPVGSRGILALGALAESSNAQLSINNIPLKYEDMSKFATKEYLVENATASLNGCHLIVASATIIELVMEELRKHNFSPERVGVVSKKGLPTVAFGTEAKASEYVAAKPLLERLTSAPVQQSAS
jgi:selenophosphate synthase